MRCHIIHIYVTITVCTELIFDLPSLYLTLKKLLDNIIRSDLFHAQLAQTAKLSLSTACHANRPMNYITF